MNRWLPYVCFPLIAMALLATAPANAASYYLDSVSGNDANTGLAPQQAWKTLAPVNARVFVPGDRILLRAGTTYTGQLAPRGCGALTAGRPNPIVIDSYGDGPRPRIDGQGKVQSALYLNNVEYWTALHLEITNDGPTPQPGRAGVQLQLDNFGTAHDIRLTDLDIHDVNGSDSKKAGGGAGIRWDAVGTTKKSRFDGLIIENCSLSRCDRDGIIGGGFSQRNQWFPSLHVVIRNNRLNDIGGDGIVPIACDGCVVEHNSVSGSGVRTPRNEGSAGIWPWGSDNTIIQYNDVSGQRGALDAQSFDSDWNCQNTLIQYNYSHDNEGGFLLVCDDGSQKGALNAGNTGTIVRYNLSVNDGYRAGGESPAIFITGPCRNTSLYNNTIYTSSSTGPAGKTTLVQMGNWDGWAANTRFYNNIFDAANPAQYDLGKAQQAIFDRNLYYGPQQNPPHDPDAIRQDPLFENPGRSDNANNYRLQPGSPALNDGLNIPDAGAVDLSNFQLSDRQAPSLGAFQAPGAAVAPPVVAARAPRRSTTRRANSRTRSVSPRPLRVRPARRRVVYPYYVLPRVRVYRPHVVRRKPPKPRVKKRTRK
ncbi:MAG TPA: right-handed parallel beta-helix repeat-containing protein [Armatimonadota bacterium]|nr:right-handed parallel beta-helix repeat-containing protein [Armatimonadota bacterium]